MADFKWVLRDVHGTDLRSSEVFASKEAAESWMGSEWSSLVAEGADRVLLMEGDQIVYDMSLQPE
jgi:hypothetical protein